MTKMRSAYSGSMPIPLSAQRKRQNSPVALGVERARRGAASPRNLIAFADQVLEHDPQQRGVAAHRRQRAGDDLRAALLDRAPEVGPHARRPARRSRRR